MVSKQKTDRTEDELKLNLNSLTLVADDDIQDSDTVMEDYEEETSFRIEDIPITMELPHRRFNAALAVGMDDKLYIYGGTYENPGRAEMTIDDFHVIDLGKLDGVRELWNRTIIKAGEIETDEEDSTDEDDSDDDQKMEDLDNNGTTLKPKEEEIKMDIDVQSKDQENATGTASTDELEDVPTGSTATATTIPSSSTATTILNPKFPTPLPFESIKSFYDRTAKEWIVLVGDRSKAGRRGAFIKAEGYWWECREEIREIEERMEESGVKEVVAVQFDKREKRR